MQLVVAGFCKLSQRLVRQQMRRGGIAAVPSRPPAAAQVLALLARSLECCSVLPPPTCADPSCPTCCTYLLNSQSIDSLAFR